MDHPYGKQYGQEGNPRAYMTMRDYRNLPYQWGIQQPVGRNPNPPRSMREYRDQWMSGPVYSVPSTCPPPLQNDYPEPRPRENEGQRHSSYQGESIHTISEKTLMIEKLNILTRRMDEMEMKNQHNIHSVNELSASQPSCYNPQSPQSPQPLQSIHPLEQAMLDLNRIMDDYVETNKKIRAHSIVTVEDNLNQKLDEFQSESDQKLDIHQESILKLTNQPVQEEEESPKEECLTIVEESCLQQPQQGLVENSESLEIGVVVCLWEKEDAIPLLLTEEAVEENKENIFLLPPTDSVYILPLPAPQSQATYNPLPAAPPESVFILSTPAAKSKPSVPAPKGKSNTPLHAMQKFKRLVAYVHTFATTSKKMANAYIAWHSGWYGCGFGFGAPGPRHF